MKSSKSFRMKLRKTASATPFDGGDDDGAAAAEANVVDSVAVEPATCRRREMAALMGGGR